MDILLEPNIAYLIILAAVLLSMMAIVTPGTGLYEVGAFFCLVLAGYVVYHLLFNWWALLLLVVSIIPFIFAIQRPKREAFLGLSIILLVVGSVFLFPSESGGPAVNPFVAIVASGLVTGYLWIAVRKSMQIAHTPPVQDLESLVGQFGEAKTRIREEGSVQVASELWSARSDEPIPVGSQIRVLRREGFILIVEKSNSHQS